jgi:type IV pilus assembly protein PilE
VNVTSKRGFTLIELMIVVAIIAILAAVTYPSYQSAVIKTKRANGWATMMQLMQQQERYYSQNNAYLAFSAGAPQAGFNTFSGDSATASPYQIKGEACTDDTITNCVLLTATQVSPFSDAKCGDLMLDSTGQRSVSVTGAKDCW